MRIPHSQLERCVSNPVAWLAAGDSLSFPPGMTYVRALRLAINKFHKTGQSQAPTVAYLAEIIQNQRAKGKFQNQPRIDEIELALQQYMSWAEESGLQVIDSNVSLARNYKATQLELIGSLARIDLLV